MNNPSQESQPLLPYPSMESAAERVVELIERSAGVLLPENCGDTEPYYLKRDIDAIGEDFSDTIFEGISNANSYAQIFGCLANLEEKVASDVLNKLENQPEGFHTINTLRIVALERCREKQRLQGIWAYDVR